MACVKPEPLYLVVYMHIPPFEFQSRTNDCGERRKASLGAGLVFWTAGIRPGSRPGIFSAVPAGLSFRGFQSLREWGTRRVEVYGPRDA